MRCWPKLENYFMPKKIRNHSKRKYGPTSPNIARSRGEKEICSALIWTPMFLTVSLYLFRASTSFSASAKFFWSSRTSFGVDLSRFPAFVWVRTSFKEWLRVFEKAIYHIPSRWCIVVQLAYGGPGVHHSLPMPWKKYFSPLFSLVSGPTWWSRLRTTRFCCRKGLGKPQDSDDPSPTFVDGTCCGGKWCHRASF